MTVAAVILVPDHATALSDAEGVATIRRVVQSAWAGGAMPVVAVSHPGSDATAVGAALDGLPASFLQPDAPAGARWFGAGLAEARSQVRDTTAALLWPCRFAWIDPETITSLIEASGSSPGVIVRAAYRGRAGFPIVVPVTMASRFEVEPTLHAYELVERLVGDGAEMRLLELGDPGIVSDVSVPRANLPAYQGPPEPPAGMPPEWNDELARQANRSAGA
jgi:CTP:molybdopterin cytidylyltransferase MocA